MHCVQAFKNHKILMSVVRFFTFEMIKIKVLASIASMDMKLWQDNFLKNLHFLFNHENHIINNT